MRGAGLGARTGSCLPASPGRGRACHRSRRDAVKITDHRIGLTLHKLPEILAGPGLGELVDALIAEDEAKRLAALDS